MQNRMIGDKEKKALENVFNAVEEFVKSHESYSFEQVIKLTEVERVHTLLYLGMVKDLIENANALKGLHETSEEEFVDIVTDDGKKSLAEVEVRTMANMLCDLIANK